jgi:glycosyltransferase involved in cell wall biosynthesis
MRFVVAQMGARRSYAVPMVLQQAGLLECFYTDLAGNVGCGQWLARVARLLGLQSAADRLRRRQVPAAVVHKTHALGRPARWLVANLLAQHGNPADRFRQQLRWSAALGQAAIRRGFGSATHLYSMLGEFGPLLGSARTAGLTVVTEFYILLSAERILRAEQHSFPEWEPAEPDFDAVRREFPEEQRLTSLADYSVCPSSTVQSDLEANFGFRSGSAAVVPYGVDEHWLDLEPRLVPGRLLFVGTAGLRKGVHYLAMASQRLMSRGHRCEFVVAGDVTDRIANQPECRHLRFLGRIPRQQVREQFAKADIFILPTLAEGSAEATYEALAAGLPVITTPAAGSVVRDGVEGFLVPERDPSALAEAIQRVVENRQLRAQLSSAARARARQYTLPHYGSRLIAALSSFRK